jgi:hypothetical protein
MIRGVLTLFIKLGFQMVFWVLVFSVKWQGQPLFYHARTLVMKNEIVKSADEYLSNLWYKVDKDSLRIN